MHILMIPSWYPKKQNGMEGSFFRDQALAIARKNVKIGVIAPQSLSLKNIFKVLTGTRNLGQSCINDHGINTLFFDFPNIFPRFPKGIEFLWEWVGLRLYHAYVKQYGTPDIIYVQSMLYAGCIALKIKNCYGIPYIVNEHSSAYGRKLLNKDEINIAGKIARHASLKYCVSPFIRQHLLDALGGTQQDWNILPNFVDSSFFNLTYEIAENRKFVFFNAGNLNKNKGHINLLKAFHQLKQEKPDIELVIAGNGSEYNHLLQMAKELNLENSVVFLGQLNRDALKKQMSQANVVVISSFYETFSMVCIEALALGKPVLATKCGGPQYIVNPEVGMLVEVDSVKSLTDGLKTIYNEFKKYDAAFIKEYCIKNYSETLLESKLFPDLDFLLNKR